MTKSLEEIRENRIVEEKCEDCGCDMNNPKDDCDCDNHTNVDEALTISQRRNKSISMKRNKAKVAIGRKRAAKKMASSAVLGKRAQRQARNQMAKKFTKDVPKSDLSPARKAAIEKRLDKMKGRINRIAKKLVKDVRRKEIERKRG